MGDHLRTPHDYLFTVEIRGQWIEATKNNPGHFDWSEERQVEAVDMEQAAYKLGKKGVDVRYKHKEIIR